jgi:chemotaxis signal transduction protein
MANAGPARENAQRQVIVLKMNENCRFGILADGLGEIPEVLESRLQPLPGMLAGGNVLAEAIVGTESPDKENLLLVLGVDRIAARLVVAAGDTATAVVPHYEAMTPLENSEPKSLKAPPPSKLAVVLST